MEFYFHHTDGDVMVLTADGGLTPENVPQFVSELDKLIEGGVKKVIVDCAKLRYVSSRGLLALLKEKRVLSERGGEIRLACVCGRVAKVLGLLGVSEKFDLYPSVDSARGSFGDLL
ncbi:MAG: STAS domain-containing protein [Acidobacteriota bacterium]|jgi:anti-sigma B factor antagonist